jgi:hypothetical protein
MGNQRDRADKASRRGNDLKRFRALIDEGDTSGKPIPFDVDVYLATKRNVSALDSGFRCAAPE